MGGTSGEALGLGRDPRGEHRQGLPGLDVPNTQDGERLFRDRNPVGILHSDGGAAKAQPARKPRLRTDLAKSRLAIPGSPASGHNLFTSIGRASHWFLVPENRAGEVVCRSNHSRLEGPKDHSLAPEFSWPPS